MTRHVSDIRRQLQEVSDLFVARYGRDSSVAEIAVKTLVSSSLLEHEVMLLEGEAAERESMLESSAEPVASLGR